MKKAHIQESETIGNYTRQNDWEVNQLEVDPVRIQDPVSGDAIILRHFDYQYPPGKKVKPTPSQLFTKDYILWLKMSLASDELEFIEDKSNPRVVFYKKGFRIFVACVPKKGSMIPWYAQEDLATPLEQKVHAR